MTYRVDIAGGLPGVVVDQQGNPVPNAKVTGGMTADVHTSTDGKRHEPGQHSTTIEVNGEEIEDVPMFTSKPSPMGSL